MHHTSLCAAVVALLSVLPGVQAGLYTKKSPVLQVEAKDYDRLIAKSNHTSIVEFYAPWCGHCQNLKPAYEKAAKNLEGLAKVAAVNCDDDANKPFCGSMGVQGFPTLKIVRPRKGGKPIVEDYNGPRTATGIVEAVVDRINNHVKKVTDKDLDKFLSEKNDTAKAILFTDKGTTTALLKSIAIDFLDVITIAQVRNKETKAVETFGIEKFPTLVLLPGGDKDAIVYEGEYKKPAIVEFLSQAGQPNPDPAPITSKTKKAKSSSAKRETASETPTAAEEQQEAPTQEAPVIVESAIPIPAINTPEKLTKECLTEKSSTCVLALVPSTHGEKAKEALSTLSDLAFKYSQGKRHLFPMFEVSKDNEAAAGLIKALELLGEVEIIAINARRGWWRRYEGDKFDHESIASWIDTIRLSEGTKKKIPEGIVAISLGASETEAGSEASPEASSEATPDATESASSEDATPVTPDASATEEVTESTSTKGADPTVEPETATQDGPEQEPVKHEEL
ncbi:hypothetical protein VTK73DRAFT_8013 [Phialemonium thermophilum]|uniref:protein disulfide-isomerase n=1 Tax=Phialemonium thermophilum TaxID=223376 RepID=A0ABR3XQD1_9PEZI